MYSAITIELAPANQALKHVGQLRRVAQNIDGIDATWMSNSSSVRDHSSFVEISRILLGAILVLRNIRRASPEKHHSSHAYTHPEASSVSSEIDSIVIALYERLLDAVSNLNYYYLSGS